MSPFVELSSDREFDVEGVAMVELVQGGGVLAFVEIDADSVTISTGPTV